MNKGDNIYLMGFMGSGKSTVGPLLAEKLQYTFYDMDTLLEEREGCSVSTIFAEKGEAYFRKIESELLTELLKKSGYVIGLGGGTIMQERNAMKLSQASACLIWLDVSPEAVWKRLASDHSRPLLEGSPEEKKEKINTLLSTRRETYARYATMREEVSHMTVEEVAAAIEEKVKKELNQPKVLVINGPNLNFLGIREPAVYGTENYDALCRFVVQEGNQLGLQVETFQSNHEGAIIDKLQEAYHKGTNAILINPGALTHYSYALRDAIASVSIPTVEVHLSDIQNREAFRSVSVTKEVCIAQVGGKGFASYQKGLCIIAEYLQKNS